MGGDVPRSWPGRKLPVDGPRLASKRGSLGAIAGGADHERHRAADHLGSRDIQQRDEGAVGPRRARTAVRAHRCRRRLRQDRHGGVSGDEPDRPGADAAGGRRSPCGRATPSCAISAQVHASGSTLWPAEPRARANVDHWMDAQQTVLNRPMSAGVLGLVRTPAEQRDMKAIAAAIEETARPGADRREAGAAGFHRRGRLHPVRHSAGACMRIAGSAWTISA